MRSPDELEMKVRNIEKLLSSEKRKSVLVGIIQLERETKDFLTAGELLTRLRMGYACALRVYKQALLILSKLDLPEDKRAYYEGVFSKGASYFKKLLRGLDSTRNSRNYVLSQ